MTACLPRNPPFSSSRDMWLIRPFVAKGPFQKEAHLHLALFKWRPSITLNNREQRSSLQHHHSQTNNLKPTKGLQRQSFLFWVKNSKGKGTQWFPGWPNSNSLSNDHQEWLCTITSLQIMRRHTDEPRLKRCSQSIKLNALLKSTWQNHLWFYWIETSDIKAFIECTTTSPLYLMTINTQLQHQQLRHIDKDIVELIFVILHPLL